MISELKCTHCSTMNHSSNEEIGVLAAILGITFVCVTTWGVLIWGVVEVVLLISRVA